MSRAEVYPWSLLTEVGDYFVVPYDFKPYQYMSMMTSQRNYKMKGRVRYACEKTTMGSIVLVAEVNEEVPPHDLEFPHGIICCYSKASAPSTVNDRTQTLGSRPKSPDRTQSQRVANMSMDMKLANLPWWRDERTGKMIGNPRIMTQEDTTKYLIKQEKYPDPNIPYPDYYRLDENLMQYEVNDDEDEDFGEHPIIGDENGDNDE